MTKNVSWGISALNHDAALAVVKNNDILFASHSERFSRKKNDSLLNKDIINYALNVNGFPERIFFYERPLLKKTRQIYSGQYKSLLLKGIKNHLKEFDSNLSKIPITYIAHHKSHAAAGYFTSKFSSAVIVVVDAIGEWDVLSIWHATGTILNKIYSEKYPHSLGLFYSAMTQRIGLTPNEEEYILMGMSSFGKLNDLYDKIRHDFFKINSEKCVKLSENLHKGCKWWNINEDNVFNIAFATQKIFQEYLRKIMLKAKQLTNEKNLVYMGGCALNCLANSTIVDIFDNIWIMPSPGDSGSALGAIAAGRNDYLNWQGPLLGYNIEGIYDFNYMVDMLIDDNVVGLAIGRAEFGPRALGNRSLLADPRSIDMKTKVNRIKRRQEFRPFAPAILEEYVHDYFNLSVVNSPYMQYIAECKEPHKFPAIVHIDGTSRVQTVNKHNYPEFYQLLKVWYSKTGCPMLLNTSLNIKGEPLVNTENDAINFSDHYKIPVVIAKLHG